MEEDIVDQINFKEFVDWDNRDRFAYHGKIIGKFYKVVY